MNDDSYEFINNADDISYTLSIKNLFCCPNTEQVKQLFSILNFISIAFGNLLTYFHLLQ